jgi:hypothetical protein
MAQLQYPVPDCTQAQTYDFVIGNPTQTTVYNGNTTFGPGHYHVLGNLYFKGGITTIQPGAVFHIDGNIVVSPKKGPVLNGYSITIGANATVNADNAVFNAACSNSMWRGFVFDPNQPAEALTLTGCGVANAQYGINVSPYCAEAYYSIQSSRFENNFTHVADAGYHQTAPNLPVCTIRDSYFYSQPNLLPPYAALNGAESWTYEGLHLTPSGNSDGMPKILLQGSNSIIGAVYGFVANQPGQALVFQDGGLLNVQRTVRVAI